MSFTVSRRTLWISLVILVIVVIITLIAMRAKSRYAYPDANAPKTIGVVSGAAAGGTGIVTITTSNRHGYSAGDVLNYGTAAYIVLASPAPTPTTTATGPFVFSISTPLAAATFTTGTTFKPAYTTLEEALEQCNIVNSNGGYATTADFDACIQNAATAYYNSMCPWTSGQNTPVLGTPVYAARATRDGEISSTSNNTDSIGKSYIGVKNSASADMVKVVNAARKADVTGATRKYLTTVCPNYYTTATGTAGASSYATWGIFTTAPSASAAASAAYYFNTTLVKFANKTEKDTVNKRFREWAKYAADNPTLANPTALIPASTLFNVTGPSGIPNYKLAQQFGPGTVTTIYDLPWNKDETTFTVPATYLLN